MSDSDLAAQWDEARTAFASSIMVDTALSSLAENLDRPEWPGTGKKDSPADYIDLTYDEVIEMMAVRSYPDRTVAELINIMTETLAFDDPFGDMVEHSETAAEAENPLLDNLKNSKSLQRFRSSSRMYPKMRKSSANWKASPLWRSLPSSLRGWPKTLWSVGILKSS